MISGAATPLGLSPYPTQEANGSCFRTQCGHLFCESCSFQHFGQSQSCPACGLSLEEADITDLTVGLPPAHFRRMMFQARIQVIRDSYKMTSLPDMSNIYHTAVLSSNY